MLICWRPESASLLRPVRFTGTKANNIGLSTKMAVATPINVAAALRTRLTESLRSAPWSTVSAVSAAAGFEDVEVCVFDRMRNDAAFGQLDAAPISRVRHPTVRLRRFGR
jgi:hypothetical protein